MRDKSTPDHANTEHGSPQRQTMHPAIWVFLIAILALFGYIFFFLKI